jgi:hypothetical protein
MPAATNRSVARSPPVHVLALVIRVTVAARSLKSIGGSNLRAWVVAEMAASAGAYGGTLAQTGPGAAGRAQGPAMGLKRGQRL